MCGAFLFGGVVERIDVSVLSDGIDACECVRGVFSNINRKYNTACGYVCVV